MYFAQVQQYNTKILRIYYVELFLFIFLSILLIRLLWKKYKRQAPFWIVF